MKAILRIPENINNIFRNRVNNITGTIVYSKNKAFYYIDQDNVVTGELSADALLYIFTVLNGFSQAHPFRFD